MIRNFASFIVFLGDYITNLYKKNNIQEGDRNLNRFEKIIIKEPELAKEQDEFNDIYLIPAKYFQKNKNNKKAKEYLQRGLLIFPKNGEMVRFLATIK